MKIAIVAPCHIQPSKAWVDALREAQVQNGVDVLIVDDSDGKIVFPPEFDVYGYAQQRNCLGEQLYALFEHFHKSSACKQFGLWRAWKLGYDVVIVIDSDCIIPKDFVNFHIFALEASGEGWTNPIHGSGWYSRGFPYAQRDLEKWAHMGLWDKSLDLYGSDRLKNKEEPTSIPFPRANVQPAQFFPLSGMNVAFRREAIPYMLFLPNVLIEDRYCIMRHDDIWGGYIFQKIAQMKNKALSFGLPCVTHDTVVVAAEDAKAEEVMIKYEEKFYAFIDEVFFASPSSDMFSRLAHEAANDPIFRDFEDAFYFQSLAFAA